MTDVQDMVAHLHRLLQGSHHCQPGVRRNLDVAALHSHHLDVVGGHLVGLGSGRRSAGHYCASQTLTGNSDDDFAGLTHTLAGVGLFASGEAHHRRIERAQLVELALDYVVLDLFEEKHGFADPMIRASASGTVH